VLLFWLTGLTFVFSKYDSVKQTVNMETDEIDFRPAHSGTGRQGYSALSSSEPTINVNVTDDDGQAVRNPLQSQQSHDGGAAAGAGTGAGAGAGAGAGSGRTRQVSTNSDVTDEDKYL
jgi:hypothetical protein